MDLLHEVKRMSSDLAAWLAGIAEEDFDFRGTDPQQHSARNHEHLWMVEWLAVDDPGIDLAFRRRVVAWVFDHWKRRLKGYRPYRDAGYRLYLYEDAAPTISVVAETPHGYPYGGEPSFVTSVDDVLRHYVGRSWRAYLDLDDTPQWLTPQRLLDAVTRHHGSIGIPVASQLGVTRAQVRRLIEQWQLAQDVNRIRKHAYPRTTDQQAVVADGFRLRDTVRRQWGAIRTTKRDSTISAGRRTPIDNARGNDGDVVRSGRGHKRKSSWDGRRVGHREAR